MCTFFWMSLTFNTFLNESLTQRLRMIDLRDLFSSLRENARFNNLHKDIKWKARRGSLPSSGHKHWFCLTLNTGGDAWGRSFKPCRISPIEGQELFVSTLSQPYWLSQRRFLLWKLPSWWDPVASAILSPWPGCSLLPILAAGWRKKALWVCPLRAKVHLVRRGQGLCIKARV